ncbi:heat shock protein beta-7-like [Poecilia reticulata]|uniref:heat shock protein beta-7-like n=1 Tax=Poecilia reticulata TaxID=8081 RepID=UPI0004A4C60F|nr:PREDICTED: heat shock protein beta-7-like [Poecilia reticulata]
MASLTTSSQRSSSSYRSSSRYSTSSSYRSDGSPNGSSDSLDALFEPFIHSANCSSLFGEEGSAGPDSPPNFSRSSFGNTGGTVTNWQGNGVRCLGDSYCMAADLSQFEPHDIVVMAYNHHVVIHAQKVLDDGSVSNTFTHKSLFPEDMDPLSVRGTLSPDGTLWVTVHRTTEPSGPDPLGVPTYSSEAHL